MEATTITTTRDWQEVARDAWEAARARQAEIAAAEKAKEDAEREAHRQKRVALLREKLAALGVPVDGVDDVPAVVDGVQFAVRHPSRGGSGPIVVVEAPCAECGSLNENLWQYVQGQVELGYVLTEWLPQVAGTGCYGCQERAWHAESAERENERAERERERRLAEAEARAKEPTLEERLLAVLGEFVERRIEAGR